MTAITIKLDFKLCRKILLRLEEVLLNGMNSSSTDYRFDGHSTEMIAYNTRKLADAKLVVIQMGSDWSDDQLRYWPIGFNPLGGLAFLAQAKDEKTWQAALETMGAQSGAPNLKTLKSILLAGAKDDA